MLARILRLVLVNVIVFLVVAEAAALALFYVDTGWLYYAYPFRPFHDPPVQVPAGQLTRQALHPYFGPTHVPGIPADLPDAFASVDTANQATNNFGFVAPFDYPYVKSSPDQFVIGLFGGSVGAWFCLAWSPRLEAALQQHAYFASRDVVPVCLSHEGYKQPQQLLVLSYFMSIGQRFDAVVNIDGFNEVALGYLNAERGVDVSMPSVMHLDALQVLIDGATLTPDRLRALTALDRDRQALGNLAGRLDRNWIAAVHVVLDRYYRFIDRRYRAGQVAFDALPSPDGDASVLRVTPSVRRGTGTEAMGDVVEQWATSSQSMHDLLAARAIPYVHVLQPNQYHTDRQFSDEEAARVINPSSPFRPGVEVGYPGLVAAIESGRFRQAGVDVFDARAILGAEAAPVYMDDCCHYTLRGNELLADFIAESLLSVDGPWQTSDDRP